MAGGLSTSINISSIPGAGLCPSKVFWSQTVRAPLHKSKHEKPCQRVLTCFLIAEAPFSLAFGSETASCNSQRMICSNRVQVTFLQLGMSLLEGAISLGGVEGKPTRKPKPFRGSNLSPFGEHPHAKWRLEAKPLFNMSTKAKALQAELQGAC